MRVVAGSAGGLRLMAPRGVRPTTDRVREALYSSLGERVRAAAVLDLYAGSGALGIEAASRGARAVVLVEQERAAVQAIRHNLETTHLAERGRVVPVSVEAFLARDPPPEAPFDLVVMDPPYAHLVPAAAGVLETLAIPGWITAGGMVVLEGRVGTDLPAPAGWEEVWRRSYGDTLVVALHLLAPDPKAVPGV